MVSKIYDACTEIKTSRLVLRPMSEADAPLVVRWRNAQHIASMSIKSVQANLTVKEHLDWFSRTREQRIDYIIELKESLHPIGGLSWVWHQFPDSRPFLEMGKYIGDPSALGKGYAIEATASWLDYAFIKIGVDDLIAITRRDNLPNIKLNRKLGFSVESWPSYFKQMPDDWIFMSLTKAKWLQSQNLNLDRKDAV